MNSVLSPVPYNTAFLWFSSDVSRHELRRMSLEWGPGISLVFLFSHMYSRTQQGILGSQVFKQLRNLWSVTDGAACRRQHVDTSIGSYPQTLSHVIVFLSWHLVSLYCVCDTTFSSFFFQYCIWHVFCPRPPANLLLYSHMGSLTVSKVFSLGLTRQTQMSPSHIQPLQIISGVQCLSESSLYELKQI